jgi:hypothetical protein
MTAWSEMQEVQFNAALAPTRAARRVVETAPGTLFPSLLPQPKPKTSGQVTDPLGTGDLLALLEEGEQ